MFELGVNKSKRSSFRSLRKTSVAVRIADEVYGEIDMSIAGSKDPQTSCQSHNLGPIGAS